MAYGIPDSRRAPAALVFDGDTLDFKRDPDSGRYLSRHWVDAAAWMHLRIPQGSILSSPEIGETISQIKYIDQNRIQAQVQDGVLSAWQTLLSRNLIRVIGIDLDLSIKSRVLYRASYVNLVTGKPDIVSGSFSTA